MYCLLAVAYSILFNTHILLLFATSPVLKILELGKEPVIDFVP
jgi:hypothetical protein